MAVLMSLGWRGRRLVNSVVNLMRVPERRLTVNPDTWRLEVEAHWKERGKTK